nr:hypothetical protein [Micromonospora sp. DSM 115978]
MVGVPVGDPGVFDAAMEFVRWWRQSGVGGVVAGECGAYPFDGGGESGGWPRWGRGGEQDFRGDAEDLGDGFDHGEAVESA